MYVEITRIRVSGVVRRCYNTARTGWRNVDVFPSSAFIESSSRWVSDRDSGDDGCLEKVIDL